MLWGRGWKFDTFQYSYFCNNLQKPDIKKTKLSFISWAISFIFYNKWHKEKVRNVILNKLCNIFSKNIFKENENWDVGWTIGKTILTVIIHCVCVKRITLCSCLCSFSCCFSSFFSSSFLPYPECQGIRSKKTFCRPSNS